MRIANQELLFKIYNVVVMVTQYFVPVMILLYAYSMMVYTIWKRRDFLEVGQGQGQGQGLWIKSFNNRRVVFFYNFCH